MNFLLAWMGFNYLYDTQSVFSSVSVLSGGGMNIIGEKMMEIEFKKYEKRMKEEVKNGSSTLG